MKAKWIVFFLVILVSAVCLFVACGDDDDDDSSGQADDDDSSGDTVSVRGILQVSDSFTGGAAGGKKALGDGLENDFDLVSYTPDSMLMTFKSISISQDDGTAIEISAPDTPVELIGLNPFETIFENEVEVAPELFGSYTKVHLAVEMAVTVSASFEVNGMTYQYDAIELELQWGGFDLELINPVTVNETGEVVIGVVLDLADILVLWRIDDGGDGYLVDATTNAYTIFSPPVILPYVGSTTPVMEQYRVSFNTDTFGDTSLYHLRVDFFFDGQGDMTVAGWCPVMLEGYNQNSEYEPAMLTYQEITKVSDTVWGIKDINDDPAAQDRVLEFPAFELADHTGSMTYGLQTFEYDAVKIE